MPRQLQASFHAKESRHITARIALVSGAQERGDVVIKKVDSEDNVSDLLTKVVFKSDTYQRLVRRGGYRTLEEMMARGARHADEGV